MNRLILICIFIFLGSTNSYSQALSTQVLFKHLKDTFPELQAATIYENGKESGKIEQFKSTPNGLEFIFESQGQHTQIKLDDTQLKINEKSLVSDAESSGQYSIKRLLIENYARLLVQLAVASLNPKTIIDDPFTTFKFTYNYKTDFHIYKLENQAEPKIIRSFEFRFFERKEKVPLLLSVTLHLVNSTEYKIVF